MPWTQAWNAFVDACLMKHCDGASVLDLRDGRVWGSSGDFGPRTYTATVTNEAGEDAPMAADVLFPSADAVEGIHELKCGFL